MELGRIGVFWFTDMLDGRQLIHLVEQCERLRYSADDARLSGRDGQGGHYLPKSL